VASNSEEKVVVEWREVGELINERLRNCFLASMCPGNAVLRGLREQFVGEFAEPCLEHRADDIDIVQIILLEEIDITLCPALATEYISSTASPTFIKSPLPSLDLLSATWNSVQTLNVTTLVVQIIDSSPWECGHPELGLVPGILQLLRDPGQSSLFDKRPVEHLQLVVHIINVRLLLVSAAASSFTKQSLAQCSGTFGCRALEVIQETVTTTFAER
jgi:hypothetical protein